MPAEFVHQDGTAEMAERPADRRRSRRIDAMLPVILENARAVTRDTSASGVFFWKRGTFMYGDSIRFDLERETDSGKILQKCRGVVVRTEPGDNGVGVAAKITESTTERVSGHRPAPELLEPAREEPRAFARAADEAPAPANETVSPEPVREVPPTVSSPAEETPASAEKTAIPDSAREEPSTLVLPAYEAPPPAEETPLAEPVGEPAPTIAWPTDEAHFLPDKAASPDTAREQFVTIAWPTDEAFFSPDKTISLDAARKEPRTDAQPFDSAPAPASDAESLDFVQGQPGSNARLRDDALASTIKTIARWSSLLRGMALDACEELQGQEALEWNIPPAADATSPRSDRVTVCSINVVGLRSDQSRVPGSSRDPGVSYRDLARMRAAAGFEPGRTGGGAGVGDENSSAARGLRIELAISALRGSPGDRTRGKVLLPGIVVRTTSAPEERQRAGDAHCYEETWYGDPREAFEAFMRLAGESAVLVNLSLLNT